MSDTMTSELSERVSELFLLSAALYFAGLQGNAEKEEETVLHDVSKQLIDLASSPNDLNEARLKLLSDGLCDAADLAISADLVQIATALKARAKAVAGLLNEVLGSVWDENTES